MRKPRISALAALLAASLSSAATTEPIYKNPFDVAVTPDGKQLVVACSGSGTVALLDAAEGTLHAEIPVGEFPSSVSIDARSGTALVTNRDSDSLTLIDLLRREVVATIDVGWAPMDVELNAQTGHVLVANSRSRDVSVVDLGTRSEVKRLRGGDGPRGLATSSDGRFIYLANLLPGPHPPDQLPVPEVTVIDARREIVAQRLGLPGANLVYGIDSAPDGSILLALSRPKNLLPLVQVAGGWTMTSGVGIVRPPGAGQDSTTHQILLDSVNRHYAEPSDVAVDTTGRWAVFTAAGADELIIVDRAVIAEIVDDAEGPQNALLGDRLDLSHRFIRGVVPTGPRPVAVALSPDGRRAYTANRLGDSISVIDVATARPLETFQLGGPQEITQQRRGERLFFNSSHSFNAQVSCGSCHPDSNQDGLVYDISPDGLGRNYVDTRPMVGVGGTGPFKWSGLNPTLRQQCGPRAATFIFRSTGFESDQLDDVVAFMWSLELPRNRYRQRNGELTPLQEWGRRIFERTVDNEGAEIPEPMRCNFCHSGPRFTNLKSFDVGSASELDKAAAFDTPALNHLPETAPYLHDGRAQTLEELWTVFSPEDTHGRALDLSKDELNALVEYLKCL